MKNAKFKKRAQNLSPLFKPQTSTTISEFKIKFQMAENKLDCFIGQKRTNKKTLPKRSPSKKANKSSNQNKDIKPQVISAKSPEKKRQDQSPDIIKELSNSILKEIQDKGIKHEWNQLENNTEDNFIEETNLDDSRIWSSPSVDKMKLSFASTIDYQTPIHYHSVETTENILPYKYKQRSQSFEGDAYTIRPIQFTYDCRTTIMIKNIPNKYTINDLSDEIDKYFRQTYDFLYLPCDLNNQCNMGYGFINFVNTQFLQDFYWAFHQFKWTKFRSEKICFLTYGRIQGITNLIDHFQHSKVLNSKEKKYRPIIKANAKIMELIKSQQQK